MSKPLVLFGTGPLAKLAHAYFSSDTDRSVAAFTVDRSYVSDSTFCDLPVVAFEEIALHYPPDRYDMFVALGYTRLNQLRREKYLAARTLGYRLVSYVSSRAIVSINCRVGDNCFILEDSIVQPFATIGHSVILMGSNRVGHHSTIDDHCYIAPHAAVSSGVQIGECCFIGANATLRDQISVGAHCIVGAGALLLADAEPNGVYAGTSAQRSKVSSNRVRAI